MPDVFLDGHIACHSFDQFGNVLLSSKCVFDNSAPSQEITTIWKVKIQKNVKRKGGSFLVGKICQLGTAKVLLKWYLS